MEEWVNYGHVSRLRAETPALRCAGTDTGTDTV